MHKTGSVSETPVGVEMHPGAQDDRDMQRLGKAQQFKRNFRFYSILGFTTTLMATWESILLTSTYGLIDGGRAGMLYVYLGSFVGFFASVVSMAEIASIAPTSGGQYHWVSEFASPRWQRFLSYLTGWLSVLGWQAALASICFLCGTLIQGLLVFNSSSTGYMYESQPWHGTLFTMAMAVLCTLVNTYGARFLPALEHLILALHLFGFVAVLVPLWAMGPPRAPSSVVWTEFTNSGGWSSLGLACLVGQLTPIFSWAGPDAATHMSEEIQHAALIVPWCMVSTALVNGALGFIMLVSLLYTMGPIAAVLDPASGFSFLPAVHHATGGSFPATNATAAIILALETCSAISILATASRQTFAFARDHALPLSDFLSRVSRHAHTPIPIPAICLSATTTLLLSLINLGSTAAFNAIAGVMIAALFTTYIVSIGAFIRARLVTSGQLPPARFSLGRLGLAVNILAVAWLSFAIVFTFFPTADKPVPVDMNWSVVVLAGVLSFAVAAYFLHGRGVYRAPVTAVRRD